MENGSNQRLDPTQMKKIISNNSLVHSNTQNMQASIFQPLRYRLAKHYIQSSLQGEKPVRGEYSWKHARLGHFLFRSPFHCSNLEMKIYLLPIYFKFNFGGIHTINNKTVLICTTMIAPSWIQLLFYLLPTKASTLPSWDPDPTRRSLQAHLWAVCQHDIGLPRCINTH